MVLTTMQFPAAPVPTDDVSWRDLRTGLWVARRDDRHLGTVERGRRWLASDADSEPIGAFRTFPEAQAAVLSPGASRVRRTPSPLAPALVAAALCAAGLASGGAWVWAFLLA